MYLESGGCLMADVQALAVTLRCQKNVVIRLRIDGLREGEFQGHRGYAIGEMPAPKILEPVLRAWQAKSPLVSSVHYPTAPPACRARFPLVAWNMKTVG